MTANTYDLPDARGHFGPYGGIFVAETLIPALAELKDACVKWVKQSIEEDVPVLLTAETGDYPHATITTTFLDSFYVVMRNGVIYQVTMQWPSMQVLSIVLVNEE